MTFQAECVELRTSFTPCRQQGTGPELDNISKMPSWIKQKVSTEATEAWCLLRSFITSLRNNTDLHSSSNETTERVFVQKVTNSFKREQQ